MKLNPSADDIRKSALASLVHSVRRETREELNDAGWFTVVDIADEAGESRNVVDKNLRKRVTGGELETKKVAIAGTPTRFYRTL